MYILSGGRDRGTEMGKPGAGAVRMGRGSSPLWGSGLCRGGMGRVM